MNCKENMENLNTIVHDDNEATKKKKKTKYANNNKYDNICYKICKTKHYNNINNNEKKKNNNNYKNHECK